MGRSPAALCNNSAGQSTGSNPRTTRFPYASSATAAALFLTCAAWCRAFSPPAQVLSNSSVSSGVGVYWMFYSGGDFEAVAPSDGMPGAEEARRQAAAAGVEGVPPGAVEGLRLRPGLAMSQVGRWCQVAAARVVTAQAGVP